MQDKKVRYLQLSSAEKIIRYQPQYQIIVDDTWIRQVAGAKYKNWSAVVVNTWKEVASSHLRIYNKP